jgi:uncharacterized membrane protein
MADYSDEVQKRQFEGMDSDQLMTILKNQDTSSYTGRDLALIKNVLADRGLFTSHEVLQEKKELTGIAGWLVLPAIGLVVTPFAAIAFIFLDIEAMADAPQRYEYLFSSEIFFNVIIALFAVVTAFFFFSKNKLAPKVVIAFLVTNLALMLIEAVMITQEFGSRVDEEAYMDLVRAVIAAAVWIPYFINSKRVKNTFVK